MPTSDTQFKKGQSGNPAGRPKGSTLANKLQSEAMKKMQVDGEKITSDEAIMRKIVRAAAAGEKWAIDIYLDRRYGKAVQPTAEITAKGYAELLAEIEEVDKHGDANTEC